LFSGATDYLTQSLQQSRDALGFNQKLSDSDNAAAGPLQRLSNLIQEQIALRKSVKTEEVAEQGQLEKVKTTKELIAEQEITLNEDLLKIKKQLSEVENDFTKTAASKYASRKILLQKEVADYRTAIDQNDTLINSGTVTPEDKLELTKRNERLSTGLVGAQDSLSKLGADPNSFSQQLAFQMTALKDQWGTMAQEMAKTFSDVFSSAVTSISSGITGLIMGTKTWGQALQEIGSQIVENIIQNFVKMAVEW